MLSTIDEKAEDSELKLDSAPKCSTKLPDIVGGHGPWQFRHWVVYFAASFCTSMHLVSVFPFSSAGWCNCTNASGFSSAETLQPTMMTVRQQDIKINVACPRFDVEFLRAEEDVPCSNVSLVIYAKCIYCLGILLSGLTAHLLKIKFGRRITSLTSCLFLVATTFAIGWSQNAVTYLILRFIISYTLMNVYLLSVSSLRECVSEEFLLTYGLIGHIGWGFAHFALPLVVWITEDWLTLSFFASGISVILFILLCFIPESVETYLSKGLRTRAQKVIRSAAWSNGYPTQDVENFSQSMYHQKPQEDLKIVCKNGNMKKYFEMVLRFLIGFSASFLYFVAICMSDWRESYRGTYFALAATTEVAAALILLFFTCFVSTKHLWSASTILASGSLLLMYAKSSQESPVPTPPYLLTMFFTSVVFTLILMKTLLQTFTTSARKWSAVVSGFALCLGALAASLNDIQKFHDWNPKLLVVFAIPNLTIGASIAVIPNKYFTL